MKLLSTCSLRKVRGRNLLIVPDPCSGNPDRILEVTDSFAWLVGHLKEDVFTVKTLAIALSERYGLDDDTAAKEAANVIQIWQDYHLIEP